MYPVLVWQTHSEVHRPDIWSDMRCVNEEICELSKAVEVGLLQEDKESCFIKFCYSGFCCQVRDSKWITRIDLWDCLRVLLK